MLCSSRDLIVPVVADFTLAECSRSSTPVARSSRQLRLRLLQPFLRYDRRAYTKFILSIVSMKKLRSQEWFGRQDKMGFLYRSWIKNQGWPHDLFDGRPVIGICNTWSELTPCNAHFREIAESVKRGVWEAGGFPLEFPVMSLGETMMRPTAMLFRNLASMDVEES